MDSPLDSPLYFAAWLRPAPLLGLALCASGFGLSAVLMFADLFGTR
jgi:hypothetical protein